MKLDDMKPDDRHELLASIAVATKIMLDQLGIEDVRHIVILSNEDGRNCVVAAIKPLDSKAIINTLENVISDLERFDPERN